MTGIEPALSAWEADVLPLNYTRTAPGPNQPVARSDMLPDTSSSQARIAATTCGHGRPGAAEQRHPPAPSGGHRPGEGGPGSPGAELAPTVLPAHPADRAHQTKLNRCRHTGPAGHHPGSWVSGRNSVLINATSPTSEDKARTRLIRWLRKRAETAGQRLFACDDLRAIHNGWQITTRCGGLGRQYRDPRFDTLRSCPRCAGRGTAGGEPCGACAATGRITIPTSRTGREVRPDDRDSFAPAE